eukprot:997345_1
MPKSDEKSVFGNNLWLFVTIGCVIGVIVIIIVVYAKKRRIRKRDDIKTNIGMDVNDNKSYGFVLHSSPQSTTDIHSPSTNGVETVNGRMSDIQLTDFNTPKMQPTTINTFDNNENEDDIDGLYTISVHETTRGNNMNDITKGNDNGEGVIDGYDKTENNANDGGVYINESDSDDSEHIMYSKPTGKNTETKKKKKPIKEKQIKMIIYNVRASSNEIHYNTK